MKQQSMLIELSKKLISEITIELNKEVGKLNDKISISEKNDILTNVDGLIAKLNSRVSQLNTILTK
jgi:hypothetical protein